MKNDKLIIDDFTKDIRELAISLGYKPNQPWLDESDEDPEVEPDKNKQEEEKH